MGANEGKVVVVDGGGGGDVVDVYDGDGDAVLARYQHPRNCAE